MLVSRSIAVLALLAVLALAAPVVASDARPLTPGAAVEDVRIFRDAIERIHPGYGRYTSVSAMDALFDDLARRAGDGSLTTDADLYLAVSRLLPYLRCDHTKAELPESLEQHRRTTPSYLPFTFRLFDGRMYVDRLDPSQVSGGDGDAAPLSRGDEVLAINGRPVGRVLADVAALVSIDGFTDDTAFVEMEYSSEYLGDAVDHFWPFLYSWPTEWTITARDRESNVVVTSSLAPMTYDAWLAMAAGDAGRYVDFPDTVELRMLDGATAMLSIGTFVNYRQPVPPESVFDPVFDELREKETTKLIIDLRACGGGSDDVPAALASYLSDTIVPSAKQPPWVRTYDVGDLRPHLSTWDESAFAMPAELFRDLGNGSYELQQPVGERRPAPARDNRFDGELIVLSSAANASGATIFIALLQQHYGATVIGAPTGGSAEGPTAGVIFFLKLPNSGVTVRVPALRS